MASKIALITGILLIFSAMMMLNVSNAFTSQVPTLASVWP